MRIRLAVLLLACTLGPGAFAMSGDRPSGPNQQWAIVYFREPTLIATATVQGPVLFVHDKLKMERGEPCTTVRWFDPERGPLEQAVTFHCIPAARSLVHQFTLTTRPNMATGIGCILTEYQFADDDEGHGVPLVLNAH
jgi:hypothetical protein